MFVMWLSNNSRRSNLMAQRFVKTFPPLTFVYLFHDIVTYFWSFLHFFVSFFSEFLFLAAQKKRNFVVNNYSKLTIAFFFFLFCRETYFEWEMQHKPEHWFQLKISPSEQFRNALGWESGQTIYWNMGK